LINSDGQHLNDLTINELINYIVQWMIDLLRVKIVIF